MDLPAKTRGHEWQYNPRLSSRDAAGCRERAEERSATTRTRFPFVADVAYGEGEDERLDIFPGEPEGPAHLFLHGGYWRGRDKSDYSYLADAHQASGATLLIANYSLCPKVRLSEIVDQTARLIGTLPRLAREFSFAPSRVTASGHSAGAHLLAAALLSPEHRTELDGILRGLVLISGIYDLTPVLSVSVNEEIRLRPEDVGPLSPILMAPVTGLPTDIVVGGAETPGWISQSARFAEHCQSAGAAAELHIAPGEDHFSIMEQYGDPRSPLANRLKALVLT